MSTISIVPEYSAGGPASFRATTGKIQSVGRTAGEALDALNAQLKETDKGTLLVVQHFRPDSFFTAQQQKRLRELMDKWRICRDTQAAFPAEEQAELESLVDAETRAAGDRAAALLRGMAS